MTEEIQTNQEQVESNVHPIHNVKTFSERIASAKSEVQEQAAKEKGKTNLRKIQLSDIERQFAKKMIPLVQNESFRAWSEFINVKIAERLGNAFRRPPEAMFDSKNDDRGEWLSFNQGVIMGMQMVRDLPTKLFECFLQEQSQD